TLVNISLPCLEWVIPTYTALVAAEATSNLARLDGVRFGHQCNNPKDIDDLYRRSRSEGFGKNTQERILLGNYMLSTLGYEKYYVKAQKVRRLITQAFDQALQEVDVIAGPTTPTVAFPFADKEGPVAMNLSDTYAIGANLAGLPALSLPVGFAAGLPVGAQLVGRAFDEARLLQVAHQYPLHTDWHTQLPTALGDASINTRETVIGLEVHVQLTTAAKISSGASTTFGAEANSQASLIDLGMPGTLANVNQGAIEQAIKFGLAVGADINKRSIFERKHYFYPDSPKGYQTTQNDEPIVVGGGIEIATKDGEQKFIRIH